MGGGLPIYLSIRFYSLLHLLFVCVRLYAFLALVGLFKTSSCYGYLKLWVSKEKWLGMYVNEYEYENDGLDYSMIYSLPRVSELSCC